MEEELPQAYFFRLKNGDDVVSEMIELSDNDEEKFLLINPLKVVYMQTGNDKYVQIAFMPWVFSKICHNQEFTIFKDDIITYSMVSDYMNSYYWSSIESLEKSLAERETVKFGEEESVTRDTERLEELMEQLGLKDIKRTFH